MSIKVLVSGYENTGKTTLISKLDDALLINCDNKSYNGSLPFAKYNDYKGIEDFKKFVNSKIKLYKEKYKKLPKFLIIDTVTHLYTNMVAYCNRAFRGFDIHKNLNTDTLELNKYIEDTLLANNINVVIVAHCIVDQKTDKHTIYANGSFKDSGSWLSVVQEALYIERSKDVHKVHIKSDYLPARSLLEWKEYEDGNVDFNEFDFKNYTDILLKNSDKVQENEL